MGSQSSLPLLVMSEHKCFLIPSLSDQTRRKLESPPNSNYKLHVQICSKINITFGTCFKTYPLKPVTIGSFIITNTIFDSARFLAILTDLIYTTFRDAVSMKLEVYVMAEQIKSSLVINCYQIELMYPTFRSLFLSPVSHLDDRDGESRQFGH